jgi:23S rRNA (cytidine1920-2'-O)/16S rRNA (cytidine1409-2'-O)-methyltransferase
VASAGKQRLDVVLVERGLCPSRESAKRAVMAGQVLLNGHPAAKPGQPIRSDDTLSVRASDRFVSRGGHKLEHALKEFELDVTGFTAVDLGSSTGGFTDCLIQSGASHVYAVDVGHNQLAWKLRQDDRVTVMEGVNARHLKPEAFPCPFPGADLVVVDCSFISLKKILPPAVALLGPQGRIVALIKPQFEAGKREADQGRGVIRDPAVHQRVIEELRLFTSSIPGMHWQTLTESPLLGPAGNKEFLVLIEKTSPKN